MLQGQDDTVLMGRAFINGSISLNNLMKVSSVRALDPMMALESFLRYEWDVPRRHQNVVHRHGWISELSGGIQNNWFIDELSKVVISSFSAAVKFVALSERIPEGVPLFAKKRRRAVRVASDDRSWHISRWTARVHQATKTNPFDKCNFECCRVLQPSLKGRISSNWISANNVYEFECFCFVSF